MDAMNRRNFLKLSGSGLAAIAVGGAGGWGLFRPSRAYAHAVSLDLRMVEVDAEMVDGVEVPMWAYSSDVLVGESAQPLGPRIPGPIIFATEGSTIHLTVRNQIPNGGPHGFKIPGVVDTGPLEVGAEAQLEFAAPRAGTYLYFDPLNFPVNRVMGLHGALVVLPKPVGQNTPYSDPTPNVQRLFDDLGTTPHFPGHPWDPDRNIIWVFSTVDPAANALAAASAGAVDLEAFLGASQTVLGASAYLPQYFTINGKSGFFAAQHGEQSGGGHVHALSPDTQAAISMHGNVGQPCLIRSLNAGLMWQSPHIHGNHVYLLAEEQVVKSDLQMIDTWTMPPGASKDLLVPYIKPPDIPAATWARFEAGENQELFPLLFPMHDHNEISNTAAGGNYPQGAATHFQFDGTITPDDEVILVERAELRLRTGQLLVSGRSSGTPGNEIAIHAGEDGTGPSIGRAVVRPDGTWAYRGRALKAVATRKVTCHNHETGAERRAVPLTIR
jgi:hypothetical protein